MAIFTAIAGSIVSAFLLPTTILGVSTAALIGGALAIGVSVGAQAFLGGKKPKQAPGQTPQAQATLNQSVGPRLRGYGRAKLGGTRAFWDSRQGTLIQAVMIHSGRIDAYEEWWIGDKRVELDGSRVVSAPFGLAGNSYVFIQGYAGTDTQSADGGIAGIFPDVWTPDHQLKGIAYFVSNYGSPPADEFQKVFPEGYNTPIRAVARLSLIYDPRTGLTAWNDNAALCILDFLTHKDGFRRSLDDIDIDSFWAFADTCDDAIPLKGGATEPRYRIWGVYSLTEDPQDVLDRMLLACDGELYQASSGKISIRGGKWKSPTVEIGAAHILSHQLEQGNNTFAAFNELKILHTSPQHDYQTMELTSWVDVAAQAVDGPLPSDVTYDLVPSATQALRLAKINIAKQNPKWRGVIATNLVGLNALGERVIRVVIPELEIDNDFLVTAFSIMPDLTGCEIGISSLDASAYEWNPWTEELSPPALPADTRPPLTIEVPTGLTLSVVNRVINGATVSVVRALVNAPSRTGLSLAGEIRTATGPGAWEAMTVAAGALEAFSGAVANATTYQVRVRWLTSDGTAGEWSAMSSIAVP